MIIKSNSKQQINNYNKSINYDQINTERSIKTDNFYDIPDFITTNHDILTSREKLLKNSND